MPNRPVIVLHGWSDDSTSFVRLADWLRSPEGGGFQAQPLFLGDYISQRDEITLSDLGHALHKALQAAAIPESPGAFDLVVHSTGSLVAREYLRQVAQIGGRPSAALSPVRRLVMLGPANFGSPLAAMGKSTLGRLIKGWKWDGLFETGTKVLDALELASPYTYGLAQGDLFDPAFPLFDPACVLGTVIVGTCRYQNPLVQLTHESGSDGTVRVSTASLNAHAFELDFRVPESPRLTPVAATMPRQAHAVLPLDHSRIHEPQDHPDVARLLQRALSIESQDYAAWVNECDAVTANTFAVGQAGIGAGSPDDFHEYMHVVFRVRDQHGAPVDDYFVEFYQQDNDANDTVFAKLHGEVMEKVTVNRRASSYRSFLFDVTDLRAFLARAAKTDVRMSLCIAHLSDRIRYRNPPEVPAAGVLVFSSLKQDLIFANEPVLIDVTVTRDTSPEVFKFERFGS